MSTRDWTIIGAVIAIIGLLIAVVMLALRAPNDENDNETDVSVQTPVEVETEDGDVGTDVDVQSSGGDAEATINTTTNVTVNTPGEEQQEEATDSETEQSQAQDGASTAGTDTSAQQQEQQQEATDSETEQSQAQDGASGADGDSFAQQQEETAQQQQTDDGDTDQDTDDTSTTIEEPGDQQQAADENAPCAAPDDPGLTGVGDGERICASPECPEQYVVKIVGDQRFKRLLLSHSVVTFYGHFNDSKSQCVSQDVLDAFETSCFAWFNDGGSRTYYHFDARPGTDDGVKRRINATESDLRSAGIASAAFEVNEKELNHFTDAGVVTLIEAMGLPCAEDVSQ